VARAIFGIDRYDAGSVKISGRRLRGGSPPAAMRAGIGFVPEDRRQQGLVMEISTARNIALASLARLRRAGLIFARTEREFGADWAKRLQVRYGRASNPVTLLSGGNQQKVVLAKWMAREPSLLIVDEPTRGIDIGTKSEVHRLISAQATDGVAVLVISSELPEVLRLADRVLVMREGRLAASLTREEATEESIVAAGTGPPAADAKAGVTA
jgi:rhamnose transport system ATP-binding protein